MRQAVGVAVFFGMLGVTLFGLIFTPIFYVIVRNLADGKKARSRRRPECSGSILIAVIPGCASGAGPESMDRKSMV